MAFNFDWGEGSIINSGLVHIHLSSSSFQSHSVTLVIATACGARVCAVAVHSARSAADVAGSVREQCAGEFVV